jgi:hypothetical protein
MLAAFDRSIDGMTHLAQFGNTGLRIYQGYFDLGTIIPVCLCAAS